MSKRKSALPSAGLMVCVLLIMVMPSPSAALEPGLYAPDLFGGIVYRIDVETYGVSVFYPREGTADGPFFCEEDAAGNLIVSVQYAGEVIRVSPQGEFIETIVSGLSGNHGLALDSSGNLYVAELFDGRIRRVSPSGEVLTVVDGQAATGDLEFDGEGNLYATAVGDQYPPDPYTGSVLRISREDLEAFGPGSAPITPTVILDGLNWATGIEYRDGRMYVAEYAEDRILSIDLTTYMDSIYYPQNGEDFPTPLGIAFDEEGNLYVSHGDRISLIDTAFNLSTVATGFMDVGGILYVAEPGPPPSGITATIAAEQQDVGYLRPGAGFWDRGYFWSGIYRSTPYRGVFQFDLSQIPDGAQILSAAVEVTGYLPDYYRRYYLTSEGVWSLRLLDSAVDYNWRSQSYESLEGRVLETIAPSLGNGDLGYGVINTFAFANGQLPFLTERVATTGKVSFRLDGGMPAQMGDAVFRWYEPVLQVVYAIEARAPVIVEGPSASAGVYEAAVEWVTDLASSSVVRYSREADLGSYEEVEDDTPVTDHRITIEGLQPETTYYYQVSSSYIADGFEYPVQSDIFQFTTQARTATENAVFHLRFIFKWNRQNTAQNEQIGLTGGPDDLPGPAGLGLDIPSIYNDRSAENCNIGVYGTFVIDGFGPGYPTASTGNFDLTFNLCTPGTYGLAGEGTFYFNSGALQGTGNFVGGLKYIYNGNYRIEGDLDAVVQSKRE